MIRLDLMVSMVCYQVIGLERNSKYRVTHGFTCRICKLISTNEHLNSAVELAGTVPLYGESTRKANVHIDLMLHVETQ